MTTDYSSDLVHALEAARIGAEIIAEGWRSRDAQVTHKGAINLLTQYDPRSEAAVVEYLSRECPGDGILAEEGGGTREAQRLWCIDPLDGTTNFAHALPFFTTSVALLVDGEAVAGVVNNPALCYVFSAALGQGAFLNGERLDLLKNDRKLLQRIVAFGCGYDRQTRPGRYIPMVEAYMTRSQGLRRTGSASLDCCFVARGWFDGYVEVNLHPWDLAAGVLIAREAGAIATDMDGGEFDPFNGRVMVARPGVHGEMLAVAEELDLFGGEFDGSYER